MLKKIPGFIIVLSVFPFSSYTQNNTSSNSPKLVVGIVIDQMRYEYINRFWNKYGEDGFKKLVNEGFSCKNTHHISAPTYTAPGHASIYTGTTPSIHGIIANEWFNRSSNSYVYCTEDSTAVGVGGSLKRGRMSPKNLLTTTVTDELRLSNNNQSKVIGISLKDRGAILPAGHTGNAAYWYDESTGNWITSTYYMPQLPQWVIDFNKTSMAENYLSKSWNTLLPIEYYTESLSDNNAYEKKFVGEEKPVFPHNLPFLKEKNGALGLLKSTPSGNTFTKDFAIQAIKSERMGKRNTTDFLAISFSSTDYIGHQFGPKSIEVEDAYLRLDKDIAELLRFLEAWAGKENILIFLTSDHAVSDSPAYLINNNIPAGYFEAKNPIDSLKRYLKDKYSDTLLLSYSNQQLYLNHTAIEQDDEMTLQQVELDVANFMLHYNGIANTVTATSLKNSSFSNDINSLIQNGYYPKRSGDVILNFEPGWLEHEKTGTTHGSPYNYDTHVPLIWYSYNIKAGYTDQYIPIINIAPTLSTLLSIPLPGACTGKPISIPIK